MSLHVQEREDRKTGTERKGREEVRSFLLFIVIHAHVAELPAEAASKTASYATPRAWLAGLSVEKLGQYR